MNIGQIGGCPLVKFEAVISIVSSNSIGDSCIIKVSGDLNSVIPVIHGVCVGNYYFNKACTYLNSVIAVVRDIGVGNCCEKSIAGLNEDAVAGGLIGAPVLDKILQDAVGDDKAAARVENNTVVGGSSTVNLQAG